MFVEPAKEVVCVFINTPPAAISSPAHPQGCLTLVVSCSLTIREKQKNVLRSVWSREQESDGRGLFLLFLPCFTAYKILYIYHLRCTSQVNFQML